MRLYPLAYLAGLLPLITIHVTYVLSAAHGQVDWCIPYIDSCASISATGREPPAYFVFRALMIPAAVLLLAYWGLSAAWLNRLTGACRLRSVLIPVLGLTAAAGLIAYSVVLGWVGEDYRTQRYIGVLIFFGFSYLAQLLITALLYPLPVIRERHRGLLYLLVFVAALALAVALGHILLGYIDHDFYKATDDAFEWCIALTLCVHVLLVAEMWRRTGFRAEFRANTHN